MQRAEKASGCLPGIIMMRVRDTDSWDWRHRRGRRTGLPGRADGIRGRRIAPGTVSYTHLDVYKRQGLDIRVFDDALTFKIALMVVNYMKYLESIDY